MDEVDLVMEMQRRVPTCESIPAFARGRARFAFVSSWQSCVRPTVLRMKHVSPDLGRCLC
eukprot:12109960-Karenia_brevis.AAC.1